MTDVARLAGVSQTSVSLVLNGMTGARISEATRLRVIEAARQVGYAPGERRQRRNGSGVIAYLVDEISTSPHPVISVDGARDAAWDAGCIVQVHVTRSDPELEAATVQALRAQRNLVGVIYSTIFTRRVTPPDLGGLPAVLLNCYAPGCPWPSVVPAEIAGGRTATEFVLSHGHRRIGLVTGEPWMDAARDRVKGYRQALTAAGIPYDPALVLAGDWMPDAGYERTFELLRLPDPPTAIFCANDLMAVGCLEALAELGLATPGEISVMGYDDHEMARYTRPPLSTCVLPSYEMARWAAETLIAVAGGGAQAESTEIDCPLVPRQSVGPPSPDSSRIAAAAVAVNGDVIRASRKRRVARAEPGPEPPAVAAEPSATA